FRQLAQPFFRQVFDLHALRRLQAPEAGSKHAVETVQVPLILHQGRAREVVEILDAVLGNAVLHRRHQGQVLGDGGGQAGRTQTQDKMREHQAPRRARKARRSNGCTSCSFFKSAPCRGGMTRCFSLVRNASGGMSSTISSFSQSSSSEVAGFFFKPGTSRIWKNTFSASRARSLRISG